MDPIVQACQKGQAGDLAREHIASVVNLFRTQEREHVELEMRIGTLVSMTADDTPRFVPGVNVAVFAQLMDDLSSVADLDSDDAWTEVADHFYKMPNGKDVRTRIEYDADSMSLRKTHTVKELLHRAVVRREDDPRDACRVDLAVEHPIAPPPAVCMLTHVRLKHRRRFVDRRNGDVVWCYELSKVWSANSRIGVDKKQQESEPIYEIEVELVDRAGRYSDGRSDNFIAESMLRKIKGLMGDAPTCGVITSIEAVASKEGKREGKSAGGKKAHQNVATRRVSGKTKSTSQPQ